MSSRHDKWLRERPPAVELDHRLEKVAEQKRGIKEARATMEASPRDSKKYRVAVQTASYFKSSIWAENNRIKELRAIIKGAPPPPPLPPAPPPPPPPPSAGATRTALGRHNCVFEGPNKAQFYHADRAMGDKARVAIRGRPGREEIRVFRHPWFDTVNNVHVGYDWRLPANKRYWRIGLTDDQVNMIVSNLQRGPRH